MSTRFLLALAGMILFLGSGTAWLLYNIKLKKNLLQNLLSLPKERRFFWYKVRKNGYQVTSHNLVKEFHLDIDSQPKSFSLKVDFFLKKENKKYVGLFADIGADEKELMKLFFIYTSVFQTDGVLFYYEDLRNFILLEQ